MKVFLLSNYTPVSLNKRTIDTFCESVCFIEKLTAF